MFPSRYKILFVVFFLLNACGFHEPPLRVLPKTEKIKERTLFIALDGVSYELMKEMKKEGHFRAFSEPSAMITTFPSATTAGFTGIYQPLGVKKAYGYESRFFDPEKNKMIGGTPFDVYKYPIEYKYYFDAFRFTMFDKGVMYAFPGIAGKNDLLRARDLLYSTKKKVLMSYLGGTDGAQHLLGKKRTKTFLVYMDRFLQGMKKEYKAKTGEALTIILFSDHGFHFDRMKTISSGKVEQAIKAEGLVRSPHLKKNNDVIFVEYGVLSNGVLTMKSGQEKASKAVVQVKGVDLAFWPDGSRIYAVSHDGDEAYFDYRGLGSYRYITVRGDPLKLKPLLRRAGLSVGQWISDKQWFSLTGRHEYPDPGHRLHAAFFDLVQYPGSVIFSLKPHYQYGSWQARTATYFRLGQKGTHGGLFWDTSAAMVMTDNPSIQLPATLRYDQLFPLLLPESVKALHGHPISSVERQ